MKLCQVLAIEKGAKQRTNKEGGDIHKLLQKGEGFTGRLKRYTPLDSEDTDTQPDEQVSIRFQVGDQVNRFQEVMKELWDIVITKDAGNQKACASIIIDGVAITDDIPATSLVFLEKQLDDIKAVISSIPELHTAHTWTWDDNKSAYVSEETTRNRTKKVTKALVLYPATDKHPAQTQTVQEDVVVGHYTEYYTSSAIPPKKKKEMLDRVYKLKKAVKEARERANATDITMFDKEAEKLLSYIFE